MRAFDWDLIRGGHYAQRSCEPHQQAEHMAAPTRPATCTKSLPTRSRPHMAQTARRGAAQVRQFSEANLPYRTQMRMRAVDPRRKSRNVERLFKTDIDFERSLIDGASGPRALSHAQKMTYSTSQSRVFLDSGCTVPCFRSAPLPQSRLAPLQLPTPRQVAHREGGTAGVVLAASQSDDSSLCACCTQATVPKLIQ